MNDEAFWMNHHASVAGKVFSLPRNDDSCARHLGRNQRFSSNQILQSFVFPDSPKKQDQTLFVFCLSLGPVMPNLNVWDHIHFPGRNMAPLNQHLPHLLGMNDDLVSAVKAKIHNHLWCFLRAPITNVMPWIMNRHHQRIASQQRQPKIKPHMALLDMHHIRIEAFDTLNDGGNHPSLLERLTQSRLSERQDPYHAVQDR